MTYASLIHDLYTVGVFAGFFALAVPYLFLIRWWATPKDERKKGNR